MFRQPDRYSLTGTPSLTGTDEGCLSLTPWPFIMTHVHADFLEARTAPTPGNAGPMFLRLFMSVCCFCLISSFAVATATAGETTGDYRCTAGSYRAAGGYAH